MIYNLLTCCAQNHGHSIQYQQISALAQKVTDWQNIPKQAEAQGLGPLCYTYMQAAGVSLPQATKRELQGLVLRHRHANQVRTQTLVEILTAYRAAGIQTLLLKGAALAHLVYPQPGLRPMRDIDILVKKSDVRQAQTLLTKLGFEAPLPSADTLPTKHLMAATRHTEGMIVSLEVHHNLFHDDYLTSMTMTDLSTAPLSFTLTTGQTAYTLGYEDMLWHLCHHISNIAYPFRLIWLADIVGFAEKFTTEIDWRFIRQQYPRVLNILSLFHWMTPLSDRLQQSANLKVGNQHPQGIGFEFKGWPRYTFAQQRNQGYGPFLSNTLYPSEWWLRLYYGANYGPSLWWHRWIRHPLHILSLIRQVMFK